MTARITTPPGIYSLEDFLDRPTCELIKREMREGAHARARIYDREWNYLERAMLRSTLQVEVGDTINALLRAKLLDMRAGLGRQFEDELSDCQGPTYLIYKPGDFFEPHKDESQRPGAPEHVRQRRVGFYGLLQDPRCVHIGLPVKGRAGLLVAFRSDVFHQVTPVTRGERYTVVSWYVKAKRKII